jgi:MYXO-CTERM domain-containing protein
MKTDWQTLVAFALVGLAAAFLLRPLFRRRPPSCGCNAMSRREASRCGCHKG